MFIRWNFWVDWLLSISKNYFEPKTLLKIEFLSEKYFFKRENGFSNNL
jgi:hypothetical protein